MLIVHINRMTLEYLSSELCYSLYSVVRLIVFWINKCEILNDLLHDLYDFLHLFLFSCRVKKCETFVILTTMTRITTDSTNILFLIYILNIFVISFRMGKTISAKGGFSICI